MELYRYLQTVWRRWWLILLMVVAGLGSSLHYAWQQPKLYQTTTSLVINPAAPNQLIPYLASSIASYPWQSVERLANSYAEYLRSATFTALVMDRLGLDPGADGYQLDAKLVPTTNFFRITVTARAPEKAQRIANGAAELFIAENLRQQKESLAVGVRLEELEASRRYYSEAIRELRTERDALLASPLTPSQKNEQLARLEARLVDLEKIYSGILADIRSFRVKEETLLNTATVVDPAPLPPRPVSPNLPRNLLFTVLATLALGVGLAFLLEYLDYTVKVPEDLEQVLGQGPLGAIGVIVPEAVAGDGYDPKLVAWHHPKNPISEAFRALRTNLQFTTLDRPLRSLVVTSAGPLEGKTVVASNLAVALAQMGKRVILADADLRRPSLHKVFKLSNEKGLTNLILEGARLEEALSPGNAAPSASAVLGGLLHATSIDNLVVLPSGPLPPNPAELLGSARAERALGLLAGAADVVVYDSPPVGPVTDAVVLGTKVDGTLLVVKAGVARRDVVGRLAADLGKLGVRVVGAVLNMVRPAGPGYRHGYYYYYYYYYRGYGDGRQGRRGGTSWRGWVGRWWGVLRGRRRQD